MGRLTVTQVFKHHFAITYALDDQRRFARMLILASLFHLVLFLSFDFTYRQPLDPITSALDITLLPSFEPPQTLPYEDLQTSSSIEEMNGFIFSANAKKLKTNKEESLRKRTISAASHEKRDAPYLERWQSYVEHFGNTHYPEVALRNHLTGDLRLLVALNKDGSLREVTVRHSSGSPKLDQAAIDLVYQAAPFEPLPSEITKDTEILEIIRTWQFRGELSTS